MLIIGLILLFVGGFLAIYLLIPSKIKSKKPPKRRKK